MKLTLALVKAETKKAIEMAKEDFGVTINASAIDYKAMLNNIKAQYTEQEIANNAVAFASKEAFRKVSVLI